MKNLVLHPETNFGRLSEELSHSGWYLMDDPTAPDPVITGEPEQVRWTDIDGVNFVSYEFKLVTKLRTLVLEGPGTESISNKLYDCLPCVDLSFAKECLNSDLIESILLGIQITDALNGYDLTPQLAELSNDEDPLIAEQASRVCQRFLADAGNSALRVLAEWKAQNPDYSVLFSLAGDYWNRLQVLRWFIRDQKNSNPDIDAVLRTALQDEDWEVRLTAVVCAARLRASNVLSNVTNVKLPTDTSDGVNRDERRMLNSVKLAAIELLNGVPVPTDISMVPATKNLMHAHILRCMAGEAVSNVEKTLLFIDSLAQPLPTDVPGPVKLPPGMIINNNQFYLDAMGIELKWVPPIAHWLGEDLPRMSVSNPIHKETPEYGFFIGKDVLREEATDTPKMFNYDEAVRHCVDLSNQLGASCRLPSADEWEMAARGPDGRRFPWGHNAKNINQRLESPWGLINTVGKVDQWSSSKVNEHTITCGGRKQWVCGARSTAASESKLAAIRLVINV